MSTARLLICAALIGLGTPANAEEFSGKVIAVMDGDTILVLRNGHPVKVRLAEIDAPEKAQAFGMASKKSLAEIVKGREVRVASRAVDDYGRLVAMIRVGEIDVNREQVRRGMAWEYSRFHSNRELMALQRDAQQAKRGLWAEGSAVEPSQWRKLYSGTAAAQPPSAIPTASGSGSPVSSDSACGKKHCSEMSSCEEAIRTFSSCGGKGLDGDADGRPCERLCADAKDKTGAAQ